ncbi:hypothetical protein TBLA_0E02760 [Henningerozyma blattae CBS 6284]|uniref:Mitochondrial fusion and transport protein UGO1 n=1 Tax=Henningerozyma blattae (strain ATCC 34711 / CBS 6284 / DSM 70876 / NBRC 10599 / NRRL Y-10934 / UCD 77-7) TaxID=1071380 RepID=I2H4N0_HENB6|nr:hypothetical protein TBLA_0E02760 [Tetrapisispora blattae CBS 6284]CCH61332.1 hypothetical protein TBLA_0E02760 [Tetrapisispora blattae CBS 6284]
MDEATIRANVRPYYNPETFNIGYPVVFNPDKGVLDRNGNSIASNLNIVKNSAENQLLLRNFNNYNDNSHGSLTSRAIKWLLTSLNLKNSDPIMNQNNTTNHLSNNLSVSNMNILNGGNNGSNINMKKNLLDFELVDFFNIKNWNNIFKLIIKNFLKNYFIHFLQQPFEISKFYLQIANFNDTIVDQKYLYSNAKIKTNNDPIDNQPILLQNQDFDEDDDIDFFPLNNGSNDNTQPISDQEDSNDNSRSTPMDHSLIHSNKIKPKSFGIFEIMNSIIIEEGFKGLWKSINTSFIYNFLNLSLNTWFIGFLLPIFNININSTDLYLITSNHLSIASNNDNINSTSVKNYLLLTYLSNYMTSLILLPIDLIRTKFLITSLNMVNANTDENTIQERNFFNSIKTWSWRQNLKIIPIDLYLLTFLNSLTKKNVTSSISNINNNYDYNFSIFNKLTFNYLFQENPCINIFGQSISLLHNGLSFCLYEIMGIMINLPIETLLHRCQIDFLLNNQTRIMSIEGEEKSNAYKVTRDEMIINPIKYEPILQSAGDTTNEKKGLKMYEDSSILDLWKGWKINVISVLCQHSIHFLNRQTKAFDDIELEF